MTDQWIGTICEILVECIMRNNSVIFFEFGQWFRRCRLQDFLSGALAVLLFGAANHLCNFENWHHGEYSCEVIWNLDQWFKKRCRLKTFLSRALTALLFSRPKPFSNFGRRYHEEQFCEIILHLDQWFRRNCRSKVFLIWISSSHFVQHSVTICAVLLEGIMRNKSVNFF